MNEKTKKDMINFAKMTGQAFEWEGFIFETKNDLKEWLKMLRIDIRDAKWNECRYDTKKDLYKFKMGVTYEKR